MRKLLNKPWFVVTVAVLALLLLGNSLRTGLNAQGYKLPSISALTASISHAGSGDAVEAETPAALSPTAVLQALPFSTKVPDPFTPRARHEADPDIVAVPDQIDRVHLSAIWTQNNSTLVLINEHICQAGDEIGRIKIDTATQDGVWVTHWKGRDFINLGEEFVLNTPAGHTSATAPTQHAL
jgi:hypothetical protein